ncbi:C69 family dipeptidase [Acidobacteriota bacterium]
MKIKLKKMSIVMLLFLFLLGTGSDLFACDTWAALANATARGLNILAKNSDRLPFSCQPLMFFPRQRWPAGSAVNLGRVQIPQVEETYATLGSSPYWCWGYEEGINEFGVAIGNEGVFTKDLIEKLEAKGRGENPDFGPTGMDLLRFGLERGKTAREALDEITRLVEKYGQFGSGMPTMGADGAYDNSYMIADRDEVWILETAGTRWIAKKYNEGITSISNRLGISDSGDLSSSDLIDYAVEKGWWAADKIDDFNFEKAYAAETPQEKARSYRASVRQKCSLGLLEEKKGEVTTRWMKRIARDRSTNPSIDLDQTASSCVAVLPKVQDELPVFWWAASTPSSSCYVPFFVNGSRIPEIVSTAGTFGKKVVPPSEAEKDSFSDKSYWWLFKDLRDKTNIDWEQRNPIVRREFDALEEEFEAGIPDVIQRAVNLRNAGNSEEAAGVLDGYTALCVSKAVEKVNELRLRFENAGVPEQFKPYLGTYLANFGTYKDTEFHVTVQNNSLSVVIPVQGVVELKEPDEHGMRYFKVSNQVAVSFEKGEDGLVSILKFHETNIFPRKKAAEEKTSHEDIPEKYRLYVGNYTVPGRDITFSIFVQKENLALQLPDSRIIELVESDLDGRWAFAQDDLAAVSFRLNSKGEVAAMNLHQTYILPRQKGNKSDQIS